MRRLVLDNLAVGILERCRQQLTRILGFRAAKPALNIVANRANGN